MLTAPLFRRSAASASSRRLAIGLLAAGALCMAAASAGTTPTVPALPARPLDATLPAYVPQPVSIDPHASYLTPGAGAVRINGAEHVDYIVERFNALYSKTHPGTTFAVDLKGTSSAAPLLTFGKTLFAAMGRAMNPIEAVPYKKIVGRDVLEIRVAHTSDDVALHLATSLAVYVNRANPLTQLSGRQIARMLSIGNPDGDLSTWGQLGLTGAWAKRPIHPYGTPSYSGFGDYMQDEHLAHRALALRHEELGNTEAILQQVGIDPAGIGVAAIGLENAHLRQLAIVGADGKVTTGTTAEVTGRTYPYGRALYFYVRRLPGQPVDPLVKEYLRLVLSRDGQAIIAIQPKGYLPLTAAQAEAELAKLN